MENDELLLGGCQLPPERLRNIVESAHLNFLIGAGTSSAYFDALGNIEDALTELADAPGSEDSKLLVRASIQAYFFENVLIPNIKILEKDPSAEDVLQSYAQFVRTLNRILLRRRSTLLPKQANIFTTNVDMLFEVSMEALSVEYTDGFSGKIRPRLDLGDFGTLRFRVGSRYDHRFEIPVFNLIKIHGSAAWAQDEQLNGKTEIYFDHGLTLVKAVDYLRQSAKQHLLEVIDEETSEGNGPLILPINKLLKNADDRINFFESDQRSSSTVDLNAVRSFTTKYNQLGIVNPDKRKFATTVLNQTYYELIRRFSNELEKENSVLFVHGFSFRDEHLRELVLRAARTNPTLQVIVFCYTRSDLRGYRDLLPESELKNGNVQFIIPDKIDEGFERRISLDVLERNYFAPIIQDQNRESNQPVELGIQASNIEVNDD